MKLSVFAVLFAAVIVSAQDHGPHLDFWATMTDCAKELKIKSDDKGLPDKDEATKKCLSKCVSLKLGTMNDKGVIDISKFPQHMKKDVEECDKSSTNKDVCKRADSFGKCMQQKMGKTHKNFSDICAKETNTTLEKRHFQMHGPPKFDEKKACFSRCLSIKGGLLKHNDEVNVEMFKKFNRNNATDIDKAVKTCQEQNTQSDKCIKSAKTMQCIWDAFIPKHNNFAEVCAKETNTTLEKGDFHMPGMHKFDEKKACFSRCMSIKLGSLKDNDEVNVESFKKSNKKNAAGVDKAVKTCQEQNTQSDKCIKSAKTIQCIWEALTPKQNKMKKQSVKVQ